MLGGRYRRDTSDLIVPLPGETLNSHLDALRTMIKLGVDFIANHNMRLLAGAETNSRETRERFNFKTKYRLIHGDAGSYRTPDGKEIRVFEYEESLRSTDTMSESDLYFLRKLHFLVSFCWNIEVYKPLLTLAQDHNIDPIDILIALIETPSLSAFFADFDSRSRTEWFDTAANIEAHFDQPGNWGLLVSQEYEKLNVQFSIIALRDYKDTLDQAILSIISGYGRIDDAQIKDVAALTFALFPSIGNAAPNDPVIIANRSIKLNETTNRTKLRSLITSNRAITLSKVLDTQGISLMDLRLAAVDDPRPRAE